MTRMVIGVVAALGLFAFACGGGSSGAGPECTKYVACCKKAGGSTATACETSFGADSSCNVSSATKEACETSCKANYDSIKMSVAALDAGTCE